VVEVRPPAEILTALDADASTDGLPFMPEMLPFVGKTFTVSAVAAKVCDTTIDGTGNRHHPDTVFLDDLRCDGSAHGGCQAGCLLMWRAAWLRPAGAEERSDDGDSSAAAELATQSNAATSRLRVHDGLKVEAYRCQATELRAASEPFAPGDRGRKYLLDLRYGNVGVARFVRVVLRALARKLGRKLGRVQRVPVASPGPPAPSEPLHLRPGELVRVKSRAEIARAVDENGNNKGLSFDWEMLPHCGRTYRVKDRVERIIDENTGTMIHIKSDCLILEGVACSGDWSEGRWFCPRAIYPYWREAWLTRADSGGDVR
jgi:hypothetical protein